MPRLPLPLLSNRPRPPAAVRPSIPWPRARLMLALASLVATQACRPPVAAGEAPVPTPLPFAVLAADGPLPPQEHAWVIFGADTVLAEVASTPREREMGLMFRESVPDGTGMLFVFGEAAVRGFWMKDTPVDLDIAFLDADYRVVDIQRLTAMDTEVRDARAPFLYALEVPQGWFSAHGIAVGTTARIEMRRPDGGSDVVPETTRGSGPRLGRGH